MQKRALILFLFGFHFLLNGQTIINLDDIKIPLPYEHINLITDRDLYLSGESIWFRADISLNNDLQELSKIFYVELFNAEQKSIAHKKYRINQGQAQGVLEIPSEFLSDTYYIRAYTNYSKNFPVETYFLSAIQIINPRVGLPAQQNTDKIEPVLYYDETASNPIKVSFSIPKKLVNRNTKVLLFSNTGFIKNATILENGWGNIEFNQQDSTDYQLVFITAQQDSIRKQLNLKRTASLAIESKQANNGQQIVSIKQGDKLPSSKIFKLELVNNQLEVLSYSEFQLNNIQTQIILSNSRLTNDGLYYFVLRDENDSIVTIKAFLNAGIAQSNKLFSKEETMFNKRQKLDIPLNKINASEFATLGIKVVQKGTVQSLTDKLELYSKEPKLLFSFLKTQFNPNELSDQEQEIFLQILNEKLKNKEFQSLYNPSKPTKLNWVPEVRDIGLSGIVVNKLTQEPVENVPVYLSIFKKNPQIHIYESQKDGSFFFSLNNFENEQDVFLCPLFENTDELELKVNKDFYPIFPKLKALPLTIDQTDANLIEQMMISAQTEIAYDLTPKFQDKSISHLPYSFENPQISVVLDDYIETSTLEIVFKELVPSVRVKKRKDTYSLSIFDSERELYYNDPLILVDEVPVFNVNELLKISPEHIEKIEIHKSPFILGDHTINGIVMIRTFTDNFGGMIMPKSSTFFEYQTLSPSFKFNALNYENATALNSRKGDFRTLLYWNPFISKKTTNPNSFFTSDQSGVYEVYIFGKLNNGQSTHYKVFDFKVTD